MILSPREALREVHLLPFRDLAARAERPSGGIAADE
jgi:hypothetical protein